MMCGHDESEHSFIHHVMDMDLLIQLYLQTATELNRTGNELLDCMFSGEGETGLNVTLLIIIFLNGNWTWFRSLKRFRP